MGMPADFANLAASRSWHISSPKIAQLRLNLYRFLWVTCLAIRGQRFFNAHALMAGHTLSVISTL